MRLVLSWLMLIETVRSVQKWKEQPHSIEAYEGKDTLLTCKVYNKVIRLCSNNEWYSFQNVRLANVSGGRTTDLSIFIQESMNGLEIPEVETAVSK